jgi:hypothetical protein
MEILYVVIFLGDRVPVGIVHRSAGPNGQSFIPPRRSLRGFLKGARPGDLSANSPLNSKCLLAAKQPTSAVYGTLGPE